MLFQFLTNNIYNPKFDIYIYIYISKKIEYVIPI